MKKKISTHLIAVMLFAVMIPATALAGGIRWQSFEKGMAMAKDQGKNVVLYFHADWCGYCKKMDKTTFRNASVIDYINDNFIAISVDSDREQKIAQSYGVRGLPTMWFVKPDSSKISHLPGYVDGKTMSSILKFIKTESYKTMSYNDFKKAL
ncbi:MAG: thioredoxin family protein [Desulfobacteraceae bacterium]|nr:thioredoxin family protein [Desulfobacteraceae bacterium]